MEEGEGSQSFCWERGSLRIKVIASLMASISMISKGCVSHTTSRVMGGGGGGGGGGSVLVGWICIYFY